MARLTNMTEISLTPLGRKKVEDMRGSGPGFAILASLFDSGGMTVRDLEVTTKINGNRIMGLIKVLYREGYVKVQKSQLAGEPV